MDQARNAANSEKPPENVDYARQSIDSSRENASVLSPSESHARSRRNSELLGLHNPESLGNLGNINGLRGKIAKRGLRELRALETIETVPVLTPRSLQSP